MSTYTIWSFSIYYVAFPAKVRWHNPAKLEVQGQCSVNRTSLFRITQPLTQLWCEQSDKQSLVARYKPSGLSNLSLLVTIRGTP